MAKTVQSCHANSENLYLKYTHLTVFLFSFGKSKSVVGCGKGVLIWKSWIQFLVFSGYELTWEERTQPNGTVQDGLNMVFNIVFTGFFNVYMDCLDIYTLKELYTVFILSLQKPYRYYVLVGFLDLSWFYVNKLMAIIDQTYRFYNANTENHRKTRFAGKKTSEEFDVSIPRTQTIYLGLFGQAGYLQSIYKLNRRNEFCVKLGDRFRMWPWIPIIIMFHLTSVYCTLCGHRRKHYFPFFTIISAVDK